MNHPSTCPVCGGPLAQGACSGLCPACLLHAALPEEPTLHQAPGEGGFGVVWIKVKKAWRRNKVWASAAAVAAGAFILGAVLSFWQAVEANRARDLAADARQAAEEANAGRKRQLREAAHSDRLLAMELFAQDRDADAFAHLARACEYDPESTLAAETAIFRLNVLNVARLVSILHGGSAFPLEPIDRSESFKRRDEREDQEVSEAVFTPDGRQVVTRSWNSWRGAARLWDADSGRMLKELPEPAAAPGTGDIRGLEVNGSYLAFDQPWEKGLADSGPIASPDGAAELMFEPEGTVLRQRGEHDERIILAPPSINDRTNARFSPDGRWVATAAVDHQVMLHPTRIQQFERQGGPTIEKLTGPDGSAQVTLHAAQSGDRLALLPGHAGNVNRVRFSADNTRVVTASDDTTARVWETADRRLLQRFGGLGQDALWSLEFSPDDRLLLGETDSRLLTWDALTGELLCDFAAQGQDGERLAASSDSKVVVVRQSGEGKAGAVQLWDGVKHGKLARLGNRDLAVDRAVFSPDDRLLATHEMDGTIRIWDGGSGRPISETPTAVVELSQLCFSPDSRHLLAVSMSKDDSPCPSLLIEAASGRVLFKLETGRYDILSASFHPSGTLLATGSNDGGARIWECPSGRLVATLPHHPQSVTSIEFSPDGKLVATACWRSTIVQVWSVDGWQRVTRIRNPQYHLVERITFSPDSRLLAASSDRADELVVWEARSGETLAAIDIPHADYRDAAFSHDGKRLTTFCRGPTGGPVTLEVPALGTPVPAWFADFLRFLLVRTIDHDGRRRVLTPLEWEALHVKVTAAAAADRSRYGELVRWFLAPAAQRPVRPGDTLTRREVADRLVTPAADPVQLQRALAFDPANPLAHLALARFEEIPQAANFLRQWARQQLPPTPPTELRQRFDAIDTAPNAGAPEPSDR